MSELPSAALARIERVLADLELAVIRALKTPPSNPNRPGDRLIFLSIHAPIQPLVLEAFRDIVAVISELPWTATERRQIVATYQDQLLVQYEIRRLSFVEALRSQEWWVTFQQRLTDAPSISQQLQALKRRARLTFEEIATATKFPKRTVERHFAGTLPPKPGSLTIYRQAFSAALKDSVDFIEPIPDKTLPRRRHVGKKPAKRR